MATAVDKNKGSNGIDDAEKNKNDQPSTMEPSTSTSPSKTSISNNKTSNHVVVALFSILLKGIKMKYLTSLLVASGVVVVWHHHKHNHHRNDAQAPSPSSIFVNGIPTLLGFASSPQNQKRTFNSNMDLSDIYTEFDDDCYMLTKEEYQKEIANLDSSTDDDYEGDDRYIEEEQEEEYEESSSSDEDEDAQYEEPKFVPHTNGYRGLYESKGIGKPDYLHLGRCRHVYNTRYHPAGGYESNIDLFHHRNGAPVGQGSGLTTPDFAKRDKCFLFCVPQLDEQEITVDLLVDAARMALPRTTQFLMEEYGLDPLGIPKAADSPGYTRPQFNAVQEALRGGFAMVAKMLSNGNLNLVIDQRQRTVQDYLEMKGSPVRPKDAIEYFGLDTTESQKPSYLNLTNAKERFYRGWKSEIRTPVDTKCHMQIVDSMDSDTFYWDYFMPNRPFVWKDASTPQELDTYAKSRWAETKSLNPKTAKFYTGTQGEPAMANQSGCGVFTIEEVENSPPCPQNGWSIIQSGYIPDYEEMYPLCNGDPFHDDCVYGRTLKPIFGDKLELSEPNHYFFFTGDDSGIPWHWHNAGFNVGFVGQKQWKLAPPYYRGFCARTPKDSIDKVPEEYRLHCTQTPGDMLYLPDFWGHMINNGGFSMGTAMLIREPFQNILQEVPPAVRPGSDDEVKTE